MGGLDRVLRTSIGMIFLSLVFLQTVSAQTQSKYVGAKVCGTCHDADGQHWKHSMHPNSIQTLTSATENKPRDFHDFELWVVRMGNGEKYGLPTRANESRYCLPCHETAFGVPAEMIATSFDPKDGIQCESCHGPGSAHMEIEAIKKSGKGIAPDEVASVLQIARTADIKNYSDENAIKAQCLGCHNGDCGPFDFEKAWPMIKH